MKNVIQFQGILGNLADSYKHIVWCCVLFIERCFLNVQIKNERKMKYGTEEKTVIYGLTLVKCLNFC